MIPIAEWAARGYPGSVNGTTGKVNGARPYDDWRTTPAKPRQVCSASECDRLAVIKGQCWKHNANRLYRERLDEEVPLGFIPDRLHVVALVGRVRHEAADEIGLLVLRLDLVEIRDGHGLLHGDDGAFHRQHP